MRRMITSALLDIAERLGAPPQRVLHLPVIVMIVLTPESEPAHCYVSTVLERTATMS